MKKVLLSMALFAVATALWAADGEAASGLISPQEAKALLAKDKSILLLDVRTIEEFEEGRIAGAILLPYDQITAKSAKKAIPSTDTRVIVYCRSGRRSAIAAKALRDLGYKRILDLGGINAWPFEVVTGKGN